jgi:glycosyltransferase involved in cell wall biosynthesis
MKRVLLLHTNKEYAISLAEAVESQTTEYEVDVVARVPIHNRIRSLSLDKYDLVQADELLVNGVLACGSSVISGTPFVVSIRGWADYTNAHGQYGRLRDVSIRFRTRFVLRYASKAIFLSNETLHEFEQRYRVNETAVIGRPIDVEYYRSSTGTTRNLSADDGKFNLLTVTNLRYKEKFDGVKNTLEGLREPFKRHEKLRYQVAGDGKYLSQLKQFLAEYPYSDRVDVLGFRSDVPQILARADAFIYLSYLDAYPTVILEAQAAGLPVIGSDTVGVPEVVGDAGILCQPTPNSVSGTVTQLLEDERLRTELAEKSKKKMETYNQSCAERHAAVWNDVLDYS